MALDFGILQPVNIAGNMMAGQQQAQQNQLAQQQLKQSQISTQHSQMQMEQLQRDRDALVKLQQQFVANGKSPDLEENFNAMIQSGIPHFVDIGTQGLQKIQQQKQFANIMGGGAAPAAAPIAAPAPTGALGSGTYDPTAAVAPVNALARSSAAPTAPVNALAAPQPAGNPLGGNVDVLRQKRDALLGMGTQQSIAAAKALDADIAIASREPVFHNVPGVGLVDPRTKQVIMPSVESTQPEIKQYEYAKAQGYKGSLFDFKREMAQAGRTPVQPVAPTVTTIQDPTNPNQMISINARDYRGGGIGSPGVIGLTGKTPAATAKQDVIDKGQAQLSSVLDDLRASYDTLDKSAAIPSTQRGTLSNLAASAQASGIGQALGRMGGTEEQSARDTINSSRMMLLNSIKQATGMSAQQLNSNVELTSWLKAVSDPTQSIETVNNILGNIEKFVASGGKYSAKKEVKPMPAGAAAPNLDALLNKYAPK
jgi:hypothetical protein